MAVAAWLRAREVSALAAYIHPEHAASAGVARALGLTASDALVDGETRWSTSGR
ncbi:hypothetical protein [Streptomyces sp. NBC_00354]|uniref:hypothetical protein n=1 Tax=Streptomyces sp. NBC_00354 TaxID=2975723 RepID=UPI002E254C8A